MKSLRLQKFLAHAGLGSRRDMDNLIVAGGVKVNGKIAIAGQRISKDDIVTINNKKIKSSVWTSIPRVWIYNKPEGEIVSRNDPAGRKTSFDNLPKIKIGKWVSVGRLDFNTSGLLIFTTSGELANNLMHPRFNVQREYMVRTNDVLNDEELGSLKSGMYLVDGIGRFQSISFQRGGGNNVWYKVITLEGRNRFVRRMFEAINYQVTRLVRVRMGIINLPKTLSKGKGIELEKTEILKIKKIISE
ncbi:MAG: pseudouridine synthase [Proteobacteria bacterium]|nr:pseudouridine synthase [Pseudomonadota bacterium]